MLKSSSRLKEEEDKRLREWHALPYRNRQSPDPPSRRQPPLESGNWMERKDLTLKASNKRKYYWTLGVAVAILVLVAVGIGTWQGLLASSRNNVNRALSSSIQPDATWNVSSAPTIRTYNFVITSVTSAQDGVPRRMLVVNGRSLRRMLGLGTQRLTGLPPVVHVI